MEISVVRGKGLESAAEAPWTVRYNHAGILAQSKVTSRKYFSKATQAPSDAPHQRVLWTLEAALE